MIMLIIIGAAPDAAARDAPDAVARGAEGGRGGPAGAQTY